MLYTNATILTLDKTRSIYLHTGSILVSNHTITAIGPTSLLTSQYPNEPLQDLTGRIIIPGLINTHIHTAQTLLRGTADDLSLVSWLCERIWPLQGNFTAADGLCAAKLSIAEMLLGGTTCFLESMFADRYGFEGLCCAVEESGIRGCLGKIVMDQGKYADGGEEGMWKMHEGLVETREQSLGGAVRMWEEWDGKAEGRIRVWFGARTPGGVSESLYQEMAEISRTKNIPITMHCAESPTDSLFFASQNHTAISYCTSLNLLSPRTVLVHMIHLSTADIHTLSQTGTHVVHCPSSNLKLASGICRVPDLLDAKINLTLGTDGAPCNNTNSMFSEMRLAGILHKVTSMNPTVVPAETVLEAATINGAKALGLEHLIGSLEVGKRADFVVLDMRAVHLQPWFNPVSAVVYSATGRDVEMVVVDGKEVVQEGKLKTMDVEMVWKEAQWRAKEVVQRAGLMEKVGAKWPVV